MLPQVLPQFAQPEFAKKEYNPLINIPINERLRNARQAKGLTLSNTVRQVNNLGISCAFSTIQSYETADSSPNRRFPSIKMLVILADLYDCSTDYLLGISDEMQRHTSDYHKLMLRNKKHSWRGAPMSTLEKDLIMHKIDTIMTL